MLLATGVAALSPEARKGFIKACMAAYCFDCGYERKECQCVSDTAELDGA